MTVAIEALSEIIGHASLVVAREKLADVATDFWRRVKDTKGMCVEDYGKLILHGTFQVQKDVDGRPREVRELYPYMFI